MVSYLFLCMKHHSEWCILHRNSAKGKSPAVVIPAPGRDIPYLLSLTAGVWLPPSPNNEQFSILAASWKKFDGDLLNDTHRELGKREKATRHAYMYMHLQISLSTACAASLTDTRLYINSKRVLYRTVLPNVLPSSHGCV